MCSNHFVVAAQDHAWHFSYKGAMTGPFNSRERAVSAAIEQATQEAEPSVEVLVRDENQNMETVWKTARAS